MHCRTPAGRRAPDDVDPFGAEWYHASAMTPPCLPSRASLLALCIAALGGTAACGGSGGDGAGGSGGSGAASSSGGEGGAGGAGGATASSTGAGGFGGEGPECELQEYPGSGASLAVDVFTATVLDAGGSPAVGTEVQLCGINLCLFGETDANGQVSVNGGGQMMKQPSFKYGDGFEYARFAVPLDMSSGDLGDLITEGLPGAGVAMTGGADAASGPVTLTLEEGASVEVDVLIYDEPDEQLFRAAAVPADQVPASVGMPAGIELVFGVAPLETIFCPAAQVTVANDAGWAADADVEFWVHGVDIFQHAAPYGGWRKLGDGRVSADGMTVSTLPEQGMAVLTTFGVKLKE